ncbi:DUF1874 domain-containing protein [Candidatus Poribacteria bacterium]|nr:DUF1874 domain-containing protein [Candidatus Poribacteria bacterium]
MILLLNAAVMPIEGTYTLKRISKSKFQRLLQEADAAGNFQSYIGYPETARLIEQLTGVEIEVSREQAELAPGDSMLIVKLRHRIIDPTRKETPERSMDDFEFFRCDWKPLDGGETVE